MIFLNITSSRLTGTVSPQLLQIDVNRTTAALHPMATMTRVKEVRPRTAEDKGQDPVALPYPADQAPRCAFGVTVQVDPAFNRWFLRKARISF